MRAFVPIVASLCLLCFAPRLADAQAFHERVDVKEIKSKGQVVGARIKLTLRPDHAAWKEVRIGITPSGGNDNNDYRGRASDPGKGFLLHQFPAITDFQKGQPKEVTLDVKYADAPKLKPGSQIEIVSAWMNGPSSVHVWGMSRSYLTNPNYKLPGQAQAQNLARRVRSKAPPNRFARSAISKAISKGAQAKTAKTGKAKTAQTGKANSRTRARTGKAHSRTRARTRVKARGR